MLSYNIKADTIDSWMPDKQLQQEVSRQLNINIEDIVPTDLENMESIVIYGPVAVLDSDNKPILNLKGLEYAANLKHLTIAGYTDEDFNNLNIKEYLSDVKLTDLYAYQLVPDWYDKFNFLYENNPDIQFYTDPHSYYMSNIVLTLDENNYHELLIPINDLKVKDLQGNTLSDIFNSEEYINNPENISVNIYVSVYDSNGAQMFYRTTASYGYDKIFLEKDGILYFKLSLSEDYDFNLFKNKSCTLLGNHGLDTVDTYTGNCAENNDLSVTTGFFITYQSNDKYYHLIYQPVGLKLYFKEIAQPVIVSYVDINGNKLAEDAEINGYVNDAYTTTEKTFNSFNLLRVEGNKTGYLSTSKQYVTFVYEHDVVNEADNVNNNIDNNNKINNNNKEIKNITSLEKAVLPMTGNNLIFIISIMLYTIIIIGFKYYQIRNKD
jgi:hypothetical protein